LGSRHRGLAVTVDPKITRPLRVEFISKALHSGILERVFDVCG
jgi:hypothetical protein